MESVTVVMTSPCSQSFGVCKLKVGVYRTGGDQVSYFECCNVSIIVQSITGYTKAFKSTGQTDSVSWKQQTLFRKARK